MSPGLLQLAAVRSDRQTHAASTVGAECCGNADHRSQTSRIHHTDIVSTSLVWLPVRRRVEFKIASLVYQMLSSKAKYLAIWPTIFISPHKVLHAPSGPYREESALSLMFTVILVTDVLLQLDHVSGTTYLPVCETQNSGNN